MTVTRLLGLRGPRILVSGASVVQGGQGVLDTPANCFVIVHPEGTVLFDTGLDPLAVGSGADRVYSHLRHAVQFDYPADRMLQFQLARVGLRLGDIDHVLVGHGHFAHTGGLDLFPDATLHIQEAELAAVDTSFEQASASLYRDFQRVARERWVTHQYDYDLFGDGSLRVLHVPGHTPGTCAALVTLQDRRVLLTGVTAINRAAFEQELAATNDWDQGQAAASIRRLKQIAHETDAELWVGHDPADPHWQAQLTV